MHSNSRVVFGLRRSAVPVYTPQQMQMQMQMQVPAMYPSQQMQTQQVQMMALPVADVVV